MGTFWAAGGGKLERYGETVEMSSLSCERWLWARSLGLNTGRQEQVHVIMSSPQRTPFRAELHRLPRQADLKPFIATTALLGPQPKRPQALPGRTAHSQQFNICPSRVWHFTSPFLWLCGTRWQYLPAKLPQQVLKREVMLTCPCLKSPSIC